ncbi:hypothetical protein FKM82_017434 [Ascaphus truei]
MQFLKYAGCLKVRFGLIKLLVHRLGRRSYSRHACLPLGWGSCPGTRGSPGDEAGQHGPLEEERDRGRVPEIRSPTGKGETAVLCR